MGLHAPAPAAPAEGGAPARSPAAAQAEDERLRREVLADPAVAAVIQRLTGSDRMMVDSTVRADAFDAKLGDLNDALVGAAWGRFFRLVLEISRNDEWNRRFRDTAPDPLGTYAHVHGDQRRIMETILRTKRVPLADMLTLFGFFTGGIEGFVLSVEDIDEDDRSRLRQGYALTTHPPIGPPTQAQNASVTAYRDLSRSCAGRIGCRRRVTSMRSGPFSDRCRRRTTGRLGKAGSAPPSSCTTRSRRASRSAAAWPSISPK